VFGYGSDTGGRVSKTQKNGFRLLMYALLTMNLIFQEIDKSDSYQNEIFFFFLSKSSIYPYLDRISRAVS